MAHQQIFKPTAFYRDPLAALKWLEAAFGFETTTLVTEPSGKVGYSEMSFLGGSVSVNPEFSSEIIGETRMMSPLDLDGRATQFIRVHLLEGLDAHCERARAAGARITQAPQDEFYGGGPIAPSIRKATCGISRSGLLTRRLRTWPLRRV